MSVVALSVSSLTGNKDRFDITAREAAGHRADRECLIDQSLAVAIGELEGAFHLRRDAGHSKSTGLDQPARCSMANAKKRSLLWVGRARWTIGGRRWALWVVLVLNRCLTR